jgi:hypothetical protein
MASVIGKAKKLKREGFFGSGDFKQIKVESSTVPLEGTGAASGPLSVELVLTDGRIIRFAHLELLLDFLKKAKKQELSIYEKKYRNRWRSMGRRRQRQSS